MSLKKSVAVLAALAVFSAQTSFALTLEQTNVFVGNGRYVPAIIVTDGPGAGTYKIGENGLTQFIIYNQAALMAWAAQMTGVAVAEIKMYAPVTTSDGNCNYDTSFDQRLTADNLIYVADTDPTVEPETDETDPNLPLYMTIVPAVKDFPCKSPCEWTGGLDTLDEPDIVLCRAEVASGV